MNKADGSSLIFGKRVVGKASVFEQVCEVSRMKDGPGVKNE